MMSEQLLLDVMLGKLARYLRMCGYDAAYAQDRGIEADEQIREWANSEGRILVTRDRELAARTDGAILLDCRDIEAQLAELAAVGFEIELPETPTRCSVCNGSVRAVGGESRPEHAPDDGELWQCQDCEQHFWKGSHWDRVTATIQGIGTDPE